MMITEYRYIYSYDIISDQSRISVPMLDGSGEMVLEIQGVPKKMSDSDFLVIAASAA